MSVCWLQGDVVRLIRCVDTHWYEGELNGRQGLFPASYVERLVEDDLSPVTSPSTEVNKIVFVLVLVYQFKDVN